MDYQAVIGAVSLAVAGYGVHQTRKQTKMMEAQAQPRAARRRGEAPKINWWNQPTTWVLGILALLAWVPTGLRYLTPEPLPSISSYGVKEAVTDAPVVIKYTKLVLQITFNAQNLYTQYPDHKIIGVALHTPSDKEPMDIDNPQKSTVFDLAPREYAFVITTNDEFRNEVNAGIKQTTYVLVLLPNNVASSGFSTLRQAVAMGGKLVTIGNGPP